MIWLGIWDWDPQLIPRLLDKVAKVAKYLGYLTTMEKENTRCIQLQNWMLFAIFATSRTGNEFGQFKNGYLLPS
jgi:hypothetical protein